VRNIPERIKPSVDTRRDNSQLRVDQELEGGNRRLDQHQQHPYPPLPPQQRPTQRSSLAFVGSPMMTDPQSHAMSARDCCVLWDRGGEGGDVPEEWRCWVCGGGTIPDDSSESEDFMLMRDSRPVKIQRKRLRAMRMRNNGTGSATGTNVVSDKPAFRRKTPNAEKNLRRASANMEPQATTTHIYIMARLCFVAIDQYSAPAKRIPHISAVGHLSSQQF